jgi:hypothetical protein
MRRTYPRKRHSCEEPVIAIPTLRGKQPRGVRCPHLTYPRVIATPHPMRGKQFLPPAIVRMDANGAGGNKRGVTKSSPLRSRGEPKGGQNLFPTDLPNRLLRSKQIITWRVHNWRFVVTILSILTLGACSLFADTTWVAGTVSGVWSRRGNPYMVTDTLTIPHDSTLQIMPGVQIYFQNQQIRRTPINVLGRLRAIGEEGDSIYFYSPVAGFGKIDNRSTPIQKYGWSTAFLILFLPTIVVAYVLLMVQQF